MLRFFLSLKKKYALSKEICHYEKKKKKNQYDSLKNKNYQFGEKKS